MDRKRAIETLSNKEQKGLKNCFWTDPAFGKCGCRHIRKLKVVIGIRRVVAICLAIKHIESPQVADSILLPPMSFSDGVRVIAT